MTDRPSFNLVDEPWIPVVMTDGANIELSLRDLFARAHQARGFNEPSPLTHISVARFLLAVAQRALHDADQGIDSPDAWVQLWREGRFNPQSFDQYLAKWSHRFDLFDSERPFAQAPSSEFVASEKPKPLNKLALELASGTNATLFDHSTDHSMVGVTPARSARLLLTALNYGFGEGGIYRDTTLVRFITFVIEGTTLFETLMLNLQIYDADDVEEGERREKPDAPWWESNASLTETKEETTPLGITDHLTRRGRKIHLQWNQDGMVEGMLYRPGIAFDSSQEGSDPFFAWQQNKDGSLSPMRFRLGRALWRDIEVLFQQVSDDDESSNSANIRPGFVDNLALVSLAVEDLRDIGERIKPIPPLRLMAFGVIPRPGQAAVDLWRIEQMPLPVSLITDPQLMSSLRDALGFVESTSRALNSAGRRLATSLLTEGDRSPDKNDVSNQLAQLRLDERFWPQLELRFHHFLQDVATRNRDNALADWMADVLALAHRAYDDAAHVIAIDARGYRAQMMGLRTLYRGLAPLQVKLEEQREFASTGIAEEVAP